MGEKIVLIDGHSILNRAFFGVPDLTSSGFTLVMAVLVAAVRFAPAHMLIAMGVAAAYLFITAVYYTVKLM